LKKNHPATLITTAIPGNACSKPETGHLVHCKLQNFFGKDFRQSRARASSYLPTTVLFQI
jgi:hypothetical protein